jgi:hypothetical protein
MEKIFENWRLFTESASILDNFDVLRAISESGQDLAGMRSEEAIEWLKNNKFPGFSETSIKNRYDSLVKTGYIEADPPYGSVRVRVTDKGAAEIMKRKGVHPTDYAPRNKIWFDATGVNRTVYFTLPGDDWGRIYSVSERGVIDIIPDIKDIPGGGKTLDPDQAIEWLDKRAQNLPDEEARKATARLRNQIDITRQEIQQRLWNEAPDRREMNIINKMTESRVLDRIRKSLVGFTNYISNVLPRIRNYWSKAARQDRFLAQIQNAAFRYDTDMESAATDLGRGAGAVTPEQERKAGKPSTAKELERLRKGAPDPVDPRKLFNLNEEDMDELIEKIKWHSKAVDARIRALEQGKTNITSKEAGYDWKGKIRGVLPGGSMEDIGEPIEMPSSDELEARVDPEKPKKTFVPDVKTVGAPTTRLARNFQEAGWENTGDYISGKAETTGRGHAAITRARGALGVSGSWMTEVEIDEQLVNERRFQTILGEILQALERGKANEVFGRTANTPKGIATRAGRVIKRMVKKFGLWVIATPSVSWPQFLAKVGIGSALVYSMVAFKDELKPWFMSLGEDVAEQIAWLLALFSEIDPTLFSVDAMAMYFAADAADAHMKLHCMDEWPLKLASSDPDTGKEIETESDEPCEKMYTAGALPPDIETQRRKKLSNYENMLLRSMEESNFIYDKNTHQWMSEEDFLDMKKAAEEARKSREWLEDQPNIPIGPRKLEELKNNKMLNIILG